MHASKLRSLPVVLMAALASPALGTQMTITALPSTGTPMYKYINASGMLAGDLQSQRMFFWDKTSGLLQLHPTGAGVPALTASWCQGVNDAGQVLGNGCIPPASGNGACSTYLFRAQPGHPTAHLDYSVLGGIFAQPGYLSEIRFSARGSVAADFYPVDGSAVSRAVVYTDAGGWHDLAGLFAPGMFVHIVAMNASDTVLIQRGNQMYLWTEQGGLTQVPAPTTAYAVDMNDAGEIAGWVPASTGNELFRWGPSRGWQVLVQGQLPGVLPERINNAGMIVGSYSGGTFLYSDALGVETVGDFSVHVVGFNARGDLMLEGHDMTTYQPIPKIKVFGQPVQLVQSIVDPGQTLIHVSGVTDLNNDGAYAVIGTVPGTVSTQTAFLVTPSRCAADFDGSGTVQVADVFAFVNAWFAGDVRADADGNGTLAVADIFAFLSAWFGGC